MHLHCKIDEQPSGRTKELKNKGNCEYVLLFCWLVISEIKIYITGVMMRNSYQSVNVELQCRVVVGVRVAQM